MISRRTVLEQLLLLAGGVLVPACGATPAPVAPKPADVPPPIKLPPLQELLPAASLSWMLMARPQEFSCIPSLDAGMRHLVSAARRQLFEHVTGVRIDTIKHLVVGSYPDSTVFLLDGVPDPIAAERKYRERLITQVTRSVFRHDVVVLRGKTAGGEKRSMAALGAETVAIEAGSWLHGRVACLYAMGKLQRAPRALEAPDVGMLLQRVGDPPLVGIAPGPFEGEWEQAMHGVLGATTAALGAVRPDKDGTMRVRVLLAGEWGADKDRAVARLQETWNDISRSAFGSLTGLDHPVEPLRTESEAGVIGISIALDGARFVDGLYHAVSAEARDIMRL